MFIDRVFFEDPFLAPLRISLLFQVIVDFLLLLLLLFFSIQTAVLCLL